MSWTTFALGLIVGFGGGIILAALLHAADEPPCADCPDGAKADSWDRTVTMLTAMGEPVVSPRVIVDLARMAYAKTPEPEDEPAPARATEGYRAPPM